MPIIDNILISDNHGPGRRIVFCIKATPGYIDYDKDRESVIDKLTLYNTNLISIIGDSDNDPIDYWVHLCPIFSGLENTNIGLYTKYSNVELDKVLLRYKDDPKLYEEKCEQFYNFLSELKWLVVRKEFKVKKSKPDAHEYFNPINQEVIQIRNGVSIHTFDISPLWMKGQYDESSKHNMVTYYNQVWNDR